MKLATWLAKHMMQWLLIFDIDIMAKTILIAEKQEAKTNKVGHIRVWGGRKRQDAINKSKKVVYPSRPQTGTGTFKKMEYGLWDTVSQLMALEIAQKLL